MKHQLIILSAILLLATIGLRLEGIMRSLPISNSIVTAAVELPILEERIAPFVNPSVHLELASSRPIVRPALPEELARTLTNTSFIVMDADSGEVLGERRSDEPLPLASLTKLVGSVVVADRVSDWSAMVEILLEDVREGEKVVEVGDRLTVADLFSATLIRSSNTGMVALGRVVGLTPSELSDAMNARASQWGLATTVITDPTGLAPTTVGSARDVAMILKKALERPEIRSAVSQAQYSLALYDQDGRIIRRKRVLNTNELTHSNALPKGLAIEGGKTGFIPQAQYHVAAQAESAQGYRFIVVVLGAKTFDARFEEARKLLEWASSIVAVPQRKT